MECDCAASIRLETERERRMIALSHQTVKRLSPCACKVLLVLCTEADDVGQGGGSHVELARRYGLNARAVGQALVILEQEQIVSISRHGREYHFTFALRQSPIWRGVST